MPKKEKKKATGIRKINLSVCNFVSQVS